MEQDRIVVEHVSFTYEGEDTPAVRGMDTQIHPGEFVAILGHNGSGKSTLAKMLNALYVPTEGRVTVCGFDTAKDELIWEIRKQTGMIFQNPDNQIVATVVREDVAFGLENIAVPTEEMPQRIDEALNAVGMGQFADSAPHMLSGGQKQRVAIAGILAMQPSVIIADEATAMLDPSGRRDVLETVMRLNREKGITVVWITHYMDEAAKADRVLVVNQGEMVLSGTPRDVFTQVDTMRAMHLDVPHMTHMAFQLREGGMNIREDILTVEEMAEEVAALLCQSKSSK